MSEALAEAISKTLSITRMPSNTCGALDKKLQIKSMVGDYVFRERWVLSLPCFCECEEKEVFKIMELVIYFVIMKLQNA